MSLGQYGLSGIRVIVPRHNSCLIVFPFFNRMRSRSGIQCIDVAAVVLLLPIFAIRAMHWVFDGHIFPDRKAVESVDSFRSEFTQFLTSQEVRPGRVLTVLHIQQPSRAAAKGIIVFVHGACARMQQFVHQILHFSQAGYEIVAYDALGCGLSEKPVDEQAYTSDELYADFLAVVAKFTVNRGAKALAIVGHSMGGAAVLRFSATAPNASFLSKSAVAICPPVFTGAASARSIFKLPASILWLIRPLLGIKARELLFGPKASTALRNQEKEASARNPVHMFRAFYNGINSNLFAHKSLGTELHVPTLFIGADGDKICPLSGVETIATHFAGSSGKLEVARECGHQCMQEDPEQVTGLLEKFFSSLK